MRERFRLIITADDRVRRNWSMRKSCKGEHVGEKSARALAYYYFLRIDTARIAVFSPLPLPLSPPPLVFTQRCDRGSRRDPHPDRSHAWQGASRLHLRSFSKSRFFAVRIYNDQVFSSPAGHENDGTSSLGTSGRSQSDINPNVVDVDE